MERQKIEQREHYNHLDKEIIYDKSGGKCCRCGKKLSFRQMTYDHFVPISKGGTNRMINMIGLCEDCNKDKDDKILSADTYPIYLHEKHKQELKGYFKSYLQSFNFVSNNNLYACDEYDIKVVPAFSGNKKNRHNKKKFRYVIKKACYCDLDRLLDYFQSYLRKYDMLGNENLVKYNIMYWFEFGCIYYIEKKDGTIIGMVTAEHTNLNLLFPHQLCIHSFFYYHTDMTKFLYQQTMRTMAMILIEEHNLMYIPVIYCNHPNDTLYHSSFYYSDFLFATNSGGFEMRLSVCYDNRVFHPKTDVKDNEVIGDKGKKELDKFFSYFNKQEKSKQKFFHKHPTLYDPMAVVDDLLKEKE